MVYMQPCASRQSTWRWSFSLVINECSNFCIRVSSSSVRALGLLGLSVGRNVSHISYSLPSMVHVPRSRFIPSSSFLSSILNSGRRLIIRASSLNCMMEIALCIWAMSRLVFSSNASSCPSTSSIPKRVHGSSLYVSMAKVANGNRLMPYPSSSVAILP